MNEITMKDLADKYTRKTKAMRESQSQVLRREQLARRRIEDKHAELAIEREFAL